MLWAYLGLRSEPSTRMLRHIADKLEVDPAWLAFGQGRQPNFVKLAGRLAEQRFAAKQLDQGKTA